MLFFRQKKDILQQKSNLHMGSIICTKLFFQAMAYWPGLLEPQHGALAKQGLQVGALGVWARRVLGLIALT